MLDGASRTAKETETKATKRENTEADTNCLLIQEKMAGKEKKKERNRSRARGKGKRSGEARSVNDRKCTHAHANAFRWKQGGPKNGIERSSARCTTPAIPHPPPARAPLLPPSRLELGFLGGPHSVSERARRFPRPRPLLTLRTRPPPAPSALHQHPSSPLCASLAPPGSAATFPNSLTWSEPSESGEKRTRLPHFPALIRAGARRGTSGSPRCAGDRTRYRNVLAAPQRHRGRAETTANVLGARRRPPRVLATRARPRARARAPRSGRSVGGRQPGRGNRPSRSACGRLSRLRCRRKMPFRTKTFRVRACEDAL